MASKNGSKELISLLQYMKDTRLDNPEIKVKDERLIELDRIVSEVKESEEWEAVEMNILEVGISNGEMKKLMYIKSIIRFFFVIVSVLIKTDLTLSYVKQESIH